MTRQTLTLLTVVMSLALTFQVSRTPAQTTGHDILPQARAAYYNLKRQNFHGLRATIEPDWEVTLGPTATPENLKVFRAVRFSMTMDANGTINVFHHVSDADRLRVDPYLTNIHENVQRLVTAFFNLWTRFMVNSPFPDNLSQIKIEDSGKDYRLLYNVDSNDVVLSLTRDLRVTEMRMTSPRSIRTIRPLFEKTPEGLVLTGYASLFEPVGEGVRTELDFTIEYQDPGAQKFPNRIVIRGVHGSEPVAAAFRFGRHLPMPPPANQ